MKNISRATLKRRAIPVTMLLILTILLSVGSGLYAGASFFAQEAPNVTVTTTFFTTTTSWTTSTIWSTVTSVVEGIWTTVQYTTSTSTVTVTGSTGPDTSTGLLLHMDGTDGSQNFVDSSLQAHSVTAKGSARISTAQSKFGGASGLFNGAGDYLSIPDSLDWAFGTGDFTIDFWVRFNALPKSGNAQIFFGQVETSNKQFFGCVYNNAGTYQLIFLVANPKIWDVNFNRNSPGLSINTWYHIALVRSGNNWYWFQDGTQLGTAYSNGTAMPDSAANFLVGATDGVSWFNGWHDEFRVSKGIARWTSNFTPPTAPY